MYWLKAHIYFLFFQNSCQALNIILHMVPYRNVFIRMHAYDMGLFDGGVYAVERKGNKSGQYGAFCLGLL